VMEILTSPAKCHFLWTTELRHTGTQRMFAKIFSLAWPVYALLHRS